MNREKGYTSKITSLYRVMKRLNIKFYKGMNIKNTSKKKHNKKYETPKNIGEKWQIDAKYVPNECKVKLPEDKQYYQYTCIDEASRERFLWWYEELTPTNTVDFVKRCVEYFGYKPKTIQTDNGTEFSYNQAKIKKEHPMDRLLKKLETKLFLHDGIIAWFYVVVNIKNRLRLDRNFQVHGKMKSDIKSES